jgi:superfamily II DNA/RNA helicase
VNDWLLIFEGDAMTQIQTLSPTIKPFISDAWEKAGFTNPTSVQMQTIPFMLAGKDVIAESPTGTGKTLSFLLPILNGIDPNSRSVQAVIIASSQELVMQIFTEAQKWTEGSGIRLASFIGGANVKRQLEKLKKFPHLVIGTPGRTLELIKQRKLKMHEVTNIVLDEGDQLLVPEHLSTIRDIVKSTLADRRQVSVFSATLPPRTEELAKELTRDAELITIKKDETIKAGKVEHLYLVCDPRDKIEMLLKVSRLKDMKGLVFINDISDATTAASKLEFKGVPAGLIHSERKKQERQSALTKFREGKTSLLLATDVAARGLDIKGVTYVIHMDFPKDINQYIHRSGRTGRFGADGIVISIVTEREERELKQFCRELGITPQKKDFYKGNMVDC